MVSVLTTANDTKGEVDLAATGYDDIHGLRKVIEDSKAQRKSSETALSFTN